MIDKFYGLTIVYSPVIVEIATQYINIVVNESKFYKAIERYMATKPKEVSTLMPYRLDSSECSLCCKTYYQHLNATTSRDRANFAAICRILLWNYYAEKFDLLEYPISTTPSSLFEETQKHLNSANEHLTNVENKMNTLTQYENETLVTVDLIHGRPKDSYTEAQLIELIRKARAAQNDIADLVDTSKRMKERHEKLAQDIAVYTEALDNLK